MKDLLLKIQNKIKKKIISIILLICMLVGIIYTNAEMQVYGETFDYYARFRLDYHIENNLLFVDMYVDEFYNVGYIQLLYANVMFDKNILQFTNIYIEDYDNYEEWFNPTTGRFRVDDKYTANIGTNDLVCTFEFTILDNTASTVISIEEIDFTGTINAPYFEDEGTVNSPSIEVDLSSSLPSIGDSLSYTIDYENHQLVVTNGSNSILFLGAEDKKGVVKSFEMFETGSNLTKIDLSSFPTTKEQKLKLYGDVDITPVTILFAARTSKVKAVYNPIETTIANRITFTDNGTPVALNKLEYRTAYSKWNDVSTLTLKQLDAYAVYGATLIFRIKAVKDKNPYSTEAKMKIAKKANPPKVTIDYSKLTVKITDKMEYRISHSGTWTAGIKSVIPIKSITNIESNNLYLEVRTVATNGKTASKITVITLEAQDNSPIIGTNLKITNNITEGKTTSITLKNESTEKIIEYALVDKDIQIASLDLTKQKWKKLNKGSEVILKEKESNSKKIIVRYAAVTTKGETPKFASKISISSEIVWVKPN